MAAKKKRDSIPFVRRPSWEVELEDDDCPYVANLAREGLLAPFVYGVAAGVKEEDCWDYGIVWPSRLELGALAMHPVVGPMLERAWLHANRKELVFGLRNAAESGNRDAASALAGWMARGSLRELPEDIDMPFAGFRVAKGGF